MKMVLLSLISVTILGSFYPLLAEEPKVYTEDDLKMYQGGNGSISDNANYDPCKVYEEIRDDCPKSDFSCWRKWDSEVMDCISNELDYLATGRRPVRVKIVK